MNDVGKLFEKVRSNNFEYLTKIQNGRVDISGKPTSRTAFPLYMESNRGNAIYKNEALKSILQKSPIHDAFF